MAFTCRCLFRADSGQSSSGIYTGIKMAAREVRGGGSKVKEVHKVKGRVGGQVGAGEVSRSCTCNSMIHHR